MGAAFAVLLLRAPGALAPPDAAAHARRCCAWAAHIVVRTGSLLGCLHARRRRAARAVGDAALGAHQIAFQLFIFLALVLDAIAIAGQVLVGRMLGAGDGEGALAAARRMFGWSLAVGCAVRRSSCWRSTTCCRARSRSDPRVLDQAQELWPLFALMQPVGALVFALDGILIGAGDTRYLASAMAFCVLRLRPDRAGRPALRLGRRRRVVGPQRADARAPGDNRRAVRVGAVGSSRRRTSAKPRQCDRILTKQPSRES